MSKGNPIREYLILGGATRSATTSLFRYLGDHPQVSCCRMKETRFFLDPDYPLQPERRFEDGMQFWDALFGGESGLERVRVEATSDYLYSPGSAERIRGALPGARMMFILREPIDRLISWHRYAIQTGRLDRGVGFADYVRSQMSAPADEAAPQHLRSLAQGRYARYLESYSRVFDHSRLRVLFFEELVADPTSVIHELCRFAGIESDFYRDYEFRKINPSRSLRNPTLHGRFMLWQRAIQRRVVGHPGLAARLAAVKRLLEPIYGRYNRGTDPVAMEIEPELLGELQDYYAEPNRALERLLDRRTPWHGGGAAG